MNYFIKWPQGPGYSLNQIRNDFKSGRLSDYCIAVNSETQEVQTVRQLLEENGDLSKLTEAESEQRISGKIQELATKVSIRSFKRYRDAYLVAKSIDTAGLIVKVLAVIIGISIGLSGLSLSGLGEKNLFVNGIVCIVGGIFLGIVTGTPIYILGILISSQGQVLKSQTDIAVLSSPFMSDHQKALAMSLIPDLPKS